jgi:glycosyltransferase involved in cell wall biosynthesis
MITTALSRNGDAAPTPDDAANDPSPASGTATTESDRTAENGHAAENGHGPQLKLETRLTKPLPSARINPPSGKAGSGVHPALAVFCWEHPDTPIGQAVRQTVAALARRKTTVHLFARSPLGLDLPDLHEHAVGDVEGEDFFARVQEFTSRAVNAFLQEFPGGSPHVTLIGYEWSGAGPLGLLRGLKNNRTIFSISTLERQRSDMTAEISKRINELECATLREAQVVLCQQPVVADVARFWTPECAPRLLAARQPFPVEQFNSSLDPGQVKARYQVGPVDPTVLYVGDFSDRYGPDLLVKAMPAILRNHPQTRLILVGDGSTYWTLRVYSRYLLLDHAIRFPGSIVDQPMHELIAAADIIAVPSRDSTPWWPIQAAWAAGRPVVATHQAAPALLEHERDSVLVYPAEQSLVWGIERILFDADLRTTLAKKARAKLEERFGWNTVAEQIEELMGVTAKG